MAAKKRSTRSAPKPKTPPKKKPRRVPALAWRSRALALYVAGWTYAQIAKRLELPASTVRDGIEAELVDETGGYADVIKQRREVKSRQLDAVIRGSLPAARAGLPNAAFVVIAAVDKQIKLHGLAAAEKVDVTGALTLNFDAHQELLSRIEKLAAPATDEPSLDVDTLAKGDAPADG